jgi:uncharacterized delta-60 repeat protein
MRRIAAASLALVCACNLITGASSLTTGEDGACPGCLPDRATAEGSVGNDGGAQDGANPTPGGALDPSFGSGGIVVSSLLPSGRAVAVRSDGKIVVAGASGGALSVVRFTPNGTLDTAFGAGGRQTHGSLTSSYGYAIAVDGQDRAIAAGYALDVDDGGSTRYAYAVRFDETGVDNGYGVGGRYRSVIASSQINAIVLGTAGDAFIGGFVGGSEWAVSHLFSGGNVDVGFGQLGVRSFDWPNGGQTLAALSMTPAGTIVAAGTARGAGDTDDFAVGQTDRNGNLVVAFGTQGLSAVQVGGDREMAFATAMQADGRIVLVGDFLVGGSTRQPLGVARINGDGSLDTTFGTGGKVTLDFASGMIVREAEDHGRAVLVDAMQRIVVIGFTHERLESSSGSGNRERYYATAARLMPDGKLDPLFGTSGKLTFAFSADTSESLAVHGAARSPDGKIVVVGESLSSLALARISP